MQLLIFSLAALAEIGGCFLVWRVMLQGGSPWLFLPALALLAAFAWLLTLTGTAAAGRAFAAYGGVYIAASLLWLWRVEGWLPDRWDMIGGTIAILGAAIILFGPRSTAIP